MDFVIYLLQLLSGLLTTLSLLGGSLIIGLFLALMMTFASRSSYYIIKKPIDALIFFIRGTPLLVQFFLIYYGSGQFGFIRESFLWTLLREPMACAIIALATNTACYTTVLLKGAIASIPQGEIDACHALGMSKWIMTYHIILPRAFRIALPAYSNEVIMVLKGTSLASTITILELMGVTQRIIAQTYETIPYYLLAGLIYLIINIVIMACFRWAEYRANRYLQKAF